MSRGRSSAYEVRCPRCDVSFPPETRECIHCGGRTGRRAAAPLVQPWIEPDSESPASHPPSPIEPEPDPFFSMQPTAGEGADGETESASLSRTLLRSLGTLIWVGLLIAFTLARNCGAE
ncbi:MAG: hypothetical protein JRF61_26210 [Deltaproteobacteria bacterium]|jgi:hypothetical protein|nr:hypothetical protein [Deltaproteobacteria bacterium]